ncbi:protein of unknown function [Streptomyces sp. KY75]|nr:protein of unknown function [Streptomyces sp. KY70]CAD5988482.1 protein of unknown function [Streptomyces sp. KY75]
MGLRPRTDRRAPAPAPRRPGPDSTGRPQPLARRPLPDGRTAGAPGGRAHLRARRGRGGPGVAGGAARLRSGPSPVHTPRTAARRAPRRPARGTMGHGRPLHSPHFSLLAPHSSLLTRTAHPHMSLISYLR